MLPFIVSRWMWQTGIGGAIPSMIAYLFSVIGTFKLVRNMFPTSRISGEKRGTPSNVDGAARFAAWFAAGVVALNPNLIYLQTTAMTEPIYLVFFIWAVVFCIGVIRACADGDAQRGNSFLRQMRILFFLWRVFDSLRRLVAGDCDCCSFGWLAWIGTFQRFVQESSSWRYLLPLPQCFGLLQRCCL